MKDKDKEQLHEALLNLEHARRGEEEERLQAEAVLEGLRVLNRVESVPEMFAELLQAVSPTIECEHVFVLQLTRDGVYEPAAVSNPVFANTFWENKGVLSRLKPGKCISCFDVALLEEWQNQPAEVLSKVTSALFAPFSVSERQGVVVAVHSQKGFFSHKHVQFAQRLIPLVEQALVRASALHETRETESRMRSILEQMFDGIVSIDSEGHVISANPAAERCFGQDEEELIAKEFLSLLKLADKTDWERFVAEYNKNFSELSKPIEFVGWRSQETEFPLELCLSRISLGDNFFYLAVIRDISQRRLLEQRLIQSQKLESLGTLSAGIAHEINTPIQYVRDNTYFIQNKFPLIKEALDFYRGIAEGSDANSKNALAEKQVEFEKLDYLLQEIPAALEDALAGAESVAKIVQSMKIFAHPGGSDKSQINLNEAIEHVVTVTKNEWKYVAEVELSLDPELPPIFCFPNELSQVLINLVVNSAHAIADKKEAGSSEPGLIRICSEIHAGFARISIQDNGCGISAENQARVFDPFFTTKAVGRGSGQGLALAYSIIVEQHNANIECHSELGQGTTFHIDLSLDS